MYPENAVYALGVRQVMPYSRWVFEKWIGWSAGDYYAIYINDLINPVVSDTAYKDEPRFTLIVEEEYMPRGEVTLYGRGTNFLRPCRCISQPTFD